MAPGCRVAWDDLRNQASGDERDLCGHLVGGLIFADDFETGNTTRWSFATP